MGDTSDDGDAMSDHELPLVVEDQLVEEYLDGKIELADVVLYGLNILENDEEMPRP